MEENLIYTISEQVDSIVDKDVETMDEWLALMDDEELLVYHRMCNQEPSDRSDNDNYQISRYALVLYCRELGLTELAISNELMTTITGAFAANVIIESLRRAGYAETEGPLLLYKETTMKLTEKGKENLQKLASSDDGDDEK